jgi:hypothetical protein
MRAGAFLLVGGLLGALLFVVPSSADAECRSCGVAERKCVRATRAELGKCKRECRTATRDRSQRAVCYATCGAVRSTEDELCLSGGKECDLECDETEDSECLTACREAMEACTDVATAVRRDCMRGKGGCKEIFQQGREQCRSLERNTRRECIRTFGESLGACLHECAETDSGEVHGCMEALKECIAACRDGCAESHPTCGGLCPPGSACAATEDGSACECVNTGVKPCVRSSPQCDGECPPGSECGLVAGDLLCGCVPAGNMPCGEAATAECNGACPEELTCREAFRGCFCVPDHGLECGRVLDTELCGGLCPQETPICVKGDDGVCTCKAIAEPPECGEVPVHIRPRAPSLRGGRASQVWRPLRRGAGLRSRLRGSLSVRRRGGLEVRRGVRSTHVRWPLSA